MACKDWKEGADLDELGNIGVWRIGIKTINYCPFCGHVVDYYGCTYMSNTEIIGFLKRIDKDKRLEEGENRYIRATIKRLNQMEDNNG